MGLISLRADTGMSSWARGFRAERGTFLASINRCDTHSTGQTTRILGRA